MKILGINATQPQNNSYSIGHFPRPYTGTYYGPSPDARDTNYVKEARNTLRSIPNMDLTLTYHEAANKLEAPNIYDLVISSFTPYELLNNIDISYSSRTIFYADPDYWIKKDLQFNGLDYSAPYFHLRKLSSLNNKLKFIIYTQFGKLDYELKEHLDRSLGNYKWVIKTGNEETDRVNLQSNIYELLSEFHISIDNGKIAVEQALGRSILQLDNHNTSFNPVISPHLPFISKLNNTIDEFQALLNHPRLSEEMIQRFIEAHPQFLLGNKYKTIRSKVQLRRDELGPLIPDFMLEPVSAFDFWRIVDLKLPHINIIKTPKNREGFNFRVLDAVNQLRKYQAYFDNPVYRRRMSDLGIDAYKPMLTVIIGLDYGGLKQHEIIELKEPLATNRIEIVTYNELIAQLQQIKRYTL